MTKGKFDISELGLSNAEDLELFTRIQEASKNSDFENLIILLNDLIERNTDCGMLIAFLANAYWDAGDFEKANKNFTQAIHLDPTNEKISVGFFHLLLETNREDEAFGEIKRFVRDGGKMLRYKEILADINQE